jgi:LCP family protein required for cell wall assembly
MWKRFAIAAVLIVALSGATTATVALNEVTNIAKEVFPKINEVTVPKEVVTPEYNGGPQTFLVLGSDRRAQSKDAEDRANPPHSDTILLVRFDPEQGQTSMLSIPRDLMVNITAPHGELYVHEKINAAYTIGNKLGGVRGGMLLAAQTIEHEVFPELKEKINGIVDVSFSGFIRVVDALGCAYVNVDHRYYHLNTGTPEENYSEINLQPGYQKLCYEHALEYVRYRHGDSDFVRVARQQDFLRDLREQAKPGIGQIDAVAKAVGHAIVQAGFHGSAEELIELAKLIAFSQDKPLRQVKFQTSNVNFKLGEGSYVTSTPSEETATLKEFLHGGQRVHVSSHSSSHPSHHRHHRSTSVSPASIGLYPTPSGNVREVAAAAVGIPFPVAYPALQTGPATLQTVRPYTIEDAQKHPHHAYVMVLQQNSLGGYYDFEGTDWSSPPIFDHATTQKIGSRTYMIVEDGEHIHVIGWHSGRVLYWLTNTLLEDLSNEQMIALARSAQTLR